MGISKPLDLKVFVSKDEGYGVSGRSLWGLRTKLMGNSVRTVEGTMASIFPYPYTSSIVLPAESWLVMRRSVGKFRLFILPGWSWEGVPFCLPISVHLMPSGSACPRQNASLGTWKNGCWPIGRRILFQYFVLFAIFALTPPRRERARDEREERGR